MSLVLISAILFFIHNFSFFALKLNGCEVKLTSTCWMWFDAGWHRDALPSMPRLILCAAAGRKRNSRWNSFISTAITQRFGEFAKFFCCISIARIACQAVIDDWKS